MTPDGTVETQQRPLTRADLACQLLARAERLPGLLGTVPLGTELQLLKRDLSRGHDVLRTAPGEASFLSVVTLVESALACLTWKQYTPEVVDAVRRAFAAGTRPGPFTFADYDAVRRHFAERGIPTTPVVDLDARSPKDPGELTGQPVMLLPSPAELKRRAASQAEVADESQSPADNADLGG